MQKMTDMKLLLLQRNTWNHLTVWEKDEFKLVYIFYQQNVLRNHIFDIYV